MTPEEHFDDYLKQAIREHEARNARIDFWLRMRYVAIAVAVGIAILAPLLFQILK